MGRLRCQNFVLKMRKTSTFAFVNIFPRPFVGHFDVGGAHDGDDETLPAQVVHHKLEAAVQSLFAAQNARRRKTNVVEKELRSVRTRAPKLFQQLSLLETG